MRRLTRGSSWREAAEWLLFVWAWLIGVMLAMVVIGLPVWATLYFIYWALT